ncbi:MAG: hypothetical protein LBU92_06180, partial [Prevotellaceae bacterium]|nr:hypothetical protein [Prevotellaceae bacterium]
MLPHKISLSGSFYSVRRSLRRDKRWLSFGFFLLVSFTMWTLRKLSDSYVYELPAQIELSMPKKAQGYILSGSELTRVRLRVEASGYDLVRYKLFKRKKFEVQLPSQTEGRSAIATTQLRGAVAQELGSSYKLLSIFPDSIRFQLSRVAVKKVPVHGDIRIGYAPQYMQRGGVQLSPDSVVISGTENAVSSVDKIFTEPLVKEKVSGSL